MAAVQDDMVRVKVSIPTGSGCVKTVTPKQVFGHDSNIQPTERSKSNSKYYAANGAPISNHGSQGVTGQTDCGEKICLNFDVVDVTRPLMSAFECADKGNRIVYDMGGSYVERKSTGQKIPLRLENKLWYLDVWVKVPRALSQGHFARQAA